MKTTPQKTLKKIIYPVMKPVIRLMLHCGVTYREFADACKHLYVDVAAENFGINGRPTNTSRIAVLTGLDRKQIKAIRDQMSSETPAVAQATDRISRVLSGWHQDELFIDANGQPRTLNEKGPDSFAELARRYGGDIPPGALLKELIRSGAVEKTPEGLLMPLARTYIPAGNKDASLQRAASVISDMGETLCHNLFDSDNQANRHFERRASNLNIPVSHIPAFKAFMAEKGQEFLEEVDAWLTANELSAESEPVETVRLGAGVYWIESKYPKDKEQAS